MKKEFGIARIFEEFFGAEKESAPLSPVPFINANNAFFAIQTVTSVLQKAALSRYEQNSLYAINEIDSSTYSTELTLHENVINPELYAERDVSRLNSIYKYYQEGVMREKRKIDYEFQMVQNKAACEMQMTGFTEIDCQKNALIYQDYLEKNQFYLFYSIVFLTISRVAYDKMGRTCVLKFRVMPVN